MGPHLCATENQMKLHWYSITSQDMIYEQWETLTSTEFETDGGSLTEYNIDALYASFSLTYLLKNSCSKCKY